MKKVNSKLLLVFFMCFGLLSCNDSDDNESITSNNGPWEIEYSITGVSGEFINTYRLADGSTQQSLQEIAPWQVSFTTTGDNTGALVTAAGENGIPGETVTLKILVDGIDAETYITNEFSPVFGRSTAVVNDSGEWDVNLTVVLENLNN